MPCYGRALLGTFTQLDDEDARAITGALALGTPGRLTAIAAGTINSNFALETDQGRWFVRVNEGKSPDDCAQNVRCWPRGCTQLAPGG